MAAADRLYRSVVAYTRFFSRGWGPAEIYEKLLEVRPVILSRAGCADVLKNHRQPVTTKKVKSVREGVVYDGMFRSPLASFLPGLLPKESEIARFEMILPHSWKGASKPMYIHLAGTGDHYFWRRRAWTVLPTLRTSNIGAISLENPFYGSRKPRGQTRSQLHHVSDLFVMGLALILECMVILYWLEERGLGPVGLTGFSMGGHNCSLAAALWPKPVPVVPCLSWSTASCVFTEGLLSQAVCWDVLEEQLFYSHIGVDERRRKLFRRIRDLESEVASATENRYPTVEQAAEWRLEEVFATGGERGGSSSAMSERGGWEAGMSEDTGMTASLNRMGLASLLLNRYSAIRREREREREKEREASERQAKRSTKRRGSPPPEVVGMMRSVLDFSTHLHNFPVPLSPDLALFVAAKDDRYIPRGYVTDVRSLWPGCSVQYISGGHVSTTVLQQNNVRHALTHMMKMAL